MLMRILVILVILIIVPALYLDRHLITSRRRKLYHGLFFLPDVLLLVGTLWLTFFETYSPSNAFVTGLFLIVFLAFTVTQAVFALFVLLGQLFHRFPRVEKGFIALGVLMAMANVYIVIAGYVEGRHRLVVRHFAYRNAELPAAFNGYRIAVFSDFHVGTYGRDPSMVRRVVDSITAQRPNLIAFAGDLVNYNAREVLPFKQYLKNLSAPDGVFSIMGNHDYMSYYRWKSEAEHQQNIRLLQSTERQMGWHLLLNSHAIVRRGGDSIAIVGVENDGRPPFPQLGDLGKAQRGLPQGHQGAAIYKILLSHDPTHWRRRVLKETDIPLMLAGHTHGMQFRILGFSPASWFYREWGGMYYEGTRALFVSTGLGEVLLPFRFGVWPEIDVITLYSSTQ